MKEKVKYLRDHGGIKKGAEVSVTKRRAVFLKNQGIAVKVKSPATSGKKEA